MRTQLTGFLLLLFFPFCALGEVDSVLQPVIDLGQPVVATVGDIEFRECRVTTQYRERKVQCAWFEVAENPVLADGKQIALFIVRLPAMRAAKAPLDPLLMIAGGPGQAASEAYLFADQTYSPLAKNRDFYLIDQRGTGHSNNLGCQDIVDAADWIGADLNAAKVETITAECLAGLAGDMAQYTTENTVRDFERARAALGVRQWNLLGVSYGTRVSTHYMRRYPSSVRTAILDGVVPPEGVLGTEIAVRSQNTLDALLSRCANDPACHQAMPNLKQELADLFKQLDSQPEMFTYEDFTSGLMEKITFSRGHLELLLRLYLYNPHSLAILPPMLHEAALNQNYAPLARASRLVIQSMGQSLAMGLHNSVMCTEEVPHFELTEALREQNTNSYMGMNIVSQLQAICRVWPKEKVADDFRAPLVSAIPTLLLSGEFDPITPPSYAESAKKHLSNARHLMLQGQGHGVSGVGCTPNLLAHFVAEASVTDLNVECLSRVSASPLFINFNGSAP